MKKCQILVWIGIFALLISSLPAYAEEESLVCRANYNKEGDSRKAIDFEDLFAFNNLWDKKDLKADLNRDGKVELEDFFQFSSVFGQICNHAPVLKHIDDIEIRELQQLFLELSATDPDGDKLYYSFAYDLGGSTASVNTAAGYFSWRPNLLKGNNPQGYNDYSATFTVRDSLNENDPGAQKVSQTVRIRVNDVNMPPSFMNIGGTSINPEIKKIDYGVDEGKELKFSVLAADDTDGDNLIYSVENNPSGSGFNPETKTFSWTPTYEQSGEYTFNLVVTEVKRPAPSLIQPLTVKFPVHVKVNSANRPPKIEKISLVSGKDASQGGKTIFDVNENQKLEFDVTASDPDQGDTFILRVKAWNPKPSGSTFENGKFVWTPDKTQGNFGAREYLVILEATQGEGYSDQKEITIRVIDSNHAPNVPVYKSPANGVSFFSNYVAFEFQLTDPDAWDENQLVFDFYVYRDGVKDPVYNLKNFPWVTIVNTHVELGWHSWQIVSRDKEGFETKGPVYRFLAEAQPYTPPPVAPSVSNAAPTANPQSVSTNEDTAKAITLTGSDAEGSALAFSIVSNPTKGTLSGLNSATGAVTYTPNANANGADSFTFKVNDGTADSNAATVSITVNAVNDAPTITSTAATATTEGQAYSYDADATDIDGDTLTFSLTTKPTGMAINSNTGLITWTPGFTQAGSHNVVVQASDGTAAASQSFTINVANVNGPPSFTPSIGPKSTNENQLLQFTVSATDPDGDAIAAYSASNLPSGSSFDPASRTFSWTPSFTQSGTYSNVRFTATDSNGFAGPEDITITVNNANRAPAADSQSATTNEDTAKSITLTGSDLDNEPLTFSIASNPSNGALSGFNANTGAVTYTPSANFNGADSFTFKANDGSADSSAATVSITINAVNDAPTANPQSVSTNEDTAKAITLTGSDAEGSALAFSIVSNPTKGALSGLNPVTGAVTYTPNANANGADSFTFKVNDGTADSNTATISISMNSISDAPTLNAIGSKSVVEGQSLSFVISGSDADGDALAFSASNVPTGASFNPSTKTFTWSPVFTQAGAYSVTFTVSDGSLTASEIVVITVIDAGNQAPILASIGNKAVTEGQTLTFSLSATDSEGTTSFTFTASGMPQGANLAGNTFAWTPGFTQAGSYSVTFFASDGTAQDSETITITVNEAGNQAPALIAASPQTVTEGQLLTFTLSATDPDGAASFTFSAANLPSGAALNPSTGVFTWTPGFTQAGTYNPTFTASDGSLTNSKAVTINVVEAGNQHPIITASDQVVNEGIALVFKVSASDVDSASLSAITASNLPQGATFANNEFRWTPGPTQGGAYDVSFSANDGQLAVTRTIRITVSDILLDSGEKKDRPAAKFIDIGNIQIPGGEDFVVPGDLQMLRLELRNSANVPIDGIKVTASSDTFDLNLAKGPFTIKPGQKLVRYLDFELPEDIEPGEHYIKMTVEHNKFHKSRYAVINVI